MCCTDIRTHTNQIVIECVKNWPLAWSSASSLANKSPYISGSHLFLFFVFLSCTASFHSFFFSSFPYFYGCFLFYVKLILSSRQVVENFSIEWIWFRKVMLNSIIFKFNGPISSWEMSNRITTQTLVFHFQNNKWMYDVQFHNLNMVGKGVVRENVIKCESSLCLFVVSLL